MAQIPPQLFVDPRAGTSSVNTDADDPAIWIHPTDPARSVVIGTDKGINNGGLFVWNVNGEPLQYVFLSHPNNVDIREGMMLGGRPVDIAVVDVRTTPGLRVFAISTLDGTLSDVTTAGGIPVPYEPYGVGMYKRATDGAVFVILTELGSGPLRQYRLDDDGTGRVRGTLVRTWSGTITAQCEGVGVDDELGYLYVSEEKHGVHKFYADPDRGDQELAVFAIGDGIVGDREGIEVYVCGQGTGYLLMSSQGNSTVKVYPREGDGVDPHRHNLITTIVPSGSIETDGLDVASNPAGPVFPHGLLAKHDSPNKRFALYAWEDIAQGYLRICSEESRCEVAANFRGNPRATCGKTTVGFKDLSTGPVMGWLWEFGDGETSTEQNPIHTFYELGAHTVKLTVVSETCAHTKVARDLVTVSDVPVADFTATPTSGSAPLAVRFADASLGVPTAWSWDFGDGTTSAAANPSHTFVNPGSYRVSLSVSNACGSTGEAMVDAIDVRPVPVNLALGRPTTASSAASGSLASNATDGDSTTFWRSGSSNVTTWLVVDLGPAGGRYDAIAIRWRNQYFARSYELQVSTTGGTADAEWRTVAATTTGVQGRHDVAIAPTTERFVRLRMTVPNAGSYRINEFEVFSDVDPITTSPSGARSDAPIARGIQLRPAVPNPFTGETTLGFHLAREEHVRLSVYDVAGARVATLVDAPHPAGEHQVRWKPHGLKAGVYFAVLETPTRRVLRRVVLSR